MTESNRLRVLILAPLPPPDHGGITTWSRSILQGFARDSSVQLDFVDSATRYRKVTTKSLLIRWVGGSAQSLRDTYRIVKSIRRNRPALLHLCTSGGPAALKDALIMWFLQRLATPGVIHYHMGRLPEIIAKGGIEWKFIRYALHRAKAVIPLDQKSEASLQNALPCIRITRLPNIVDIDKIDALRTQAPVAPAGSEGFLRILFAGHVVPAKGLRELVSAYAKISDYPLGLDILGPVTPGFRKELEAIGGRSVGQKQLRLLGAVEHDEAIRHIASADLFVLPSYSEGMPNVVMEAMACGRAIISTDVGAIPEMLDIGGPEECGVCVPPRDVEALTAAIRRLAGDPVLRQELARRARERVEKNYSVPVGCGKLLELWRSVANVN